MSDQEKFEAWYGEHYTTYLPKDDAGEYCNLDTLLAWKTWLESRRAALEDAAQVCDDMAEDWNQTARGHNNGTYDNMTQAADRCGDEIRALVDGDKR